MNPYNVEGRDVLENTPPPNPQEISQGLGFCTPRPERLPEGKALGRSPIHPSSQQCTDSISDTCTNRHKLHAHIHGVHCMHAQAHKPNSACQPVLKQVCQCALCSVEGACIISHRFIALYGTHWVQPSTHPCCTGAHIYTAPYCQCTIQHSILS